jgi:hypothetical protein
MHSGYVYIADRTRGIDMLRLTTGVSAARSSGREVAVAAPSARQRHFLTHVAARYKPDPGTRSSASSRSDSRTHRRTVSAV